MNALDWSMPTARDAPWNFAKPQKKPSLHPTSRKPSTPSSGRFNAFSFSNVRESPEASGNDWYWGPCALDYSPRLVDADSAPCALERSQASEKSLVAPNIQEAESAQFRQLQRLQLLQRP